MTDSFHNDRRQQEKDQFVYINRRKNVWQPFIWQHYVAPGPLPTSVEAHEFSQRSRYTYNVDKLHCKSLELAYALRGLKEGLRERNLDKILSIRLKLKPIVTQVRVAEAALWPDHPLLPDWKQYSHRIRDDYENYYKNVGRAVETLAWGQALDNYLEVRRLHGEAINCGPRLRDWGRRFQAQPLSLSHVRQERRAIKRVISKNGARRSSNAAGVSVSDQQQDILLHRAESQIHKMYCSLSAPRMSLWSLLGRDGPLRHAVYQLRVTLQALNFDQDVLPARMSQFLLAGGDTEDNRNAWVRHVDLWWQCRMAHTVFSQFQVIHAPPDVQHMCSPS